MPLILPSLRRGRPCAGADSFEGSTASADRGIGTVADGFGASATKAVCAQNSKAGNSTKRRVTVAQTLTKRETQKLILTYLIVSLPVLLVSSEGQFGDGDSQAVASAFTTCCRSRGLSPIRSHRAKGRTAASEELMAEIPPKMSAW